MRGLRRPVCRHTVAGYETLTSYPVFGLSCCKLYLQINAAVIQDNHTRIVYYAASLPHCTAAEKQELRVQRRARDQSLITETLTETIRKSVGSDEYDQEGCDKADDVLAARHLRVAVVNVTFCE